MDLTDFIRLHHIRTPNIMWFLGAGASAAANIPTAWNMIWDFKRALYCAAQRVPISACEDLGDPILRDRLQQHFEGLGVFPPSGADEEYTVYFEQMYPDEADRRRYIERMIADATPSYGHHVLAAMMKLDMVRVIWTTNFDRVVEDAAMPVLGGTGRLVVSDLDHATVAREALNEGRWPLLVKLHGDFQSRRLKNTVEELREQDEELRRALIHACGRFGLAVVGYSGRDDSIMRAVEAVLEIDGGFPHGLYWFHRSDGPPLARVMKLIERAARAGVNAHLIEIETFDELFGDLMTLVQDLPENLQRRLDSRARRRTDAPVPAFGNSYPVIRLNALPITSAPEVCRRVKCGIGGAKDVRDAVAKAGAGIVAGRRKSGVIAFGPDTEVRRTFTDHGIELFDVQPLQQYKLQYEDSAETGMVLEALTRALDRERPVRALQRGSRRFLVVDPKRLSNPLLQPLTDAVNAITGTVPGAGLRWIEAVRLRLDQRLGRLWLLLLPTVRLQRTDDNDRFAVGHDFIRERLARRRNSETDVVLNAWVHLILGGEGIADLAAFGIEEDQGIDARFTIAPMTAFSRKFVPQRNRNTRSAAYTCCSRIASQEAASWLMTPAKQRRTRHGYPVMGASQSRSSPSTRNARRTARVTRWRACCATAPTVIHWSIGSWVLSVWV